MFGIALAPGLLVGTATSGALELTGSVKFIALIGGFLAAVATIVGIVYGVKWKSAYDVEHALKDALEDRVRLVVNERDEAREKVDKVAAVLVESQKTIARLEALPNLERVLELINDTFSRLGGRLEELHHDGEANAVQRHGDVLAELRKAAA